MKPLDRIGLDCLSIFGLPPTQFIELASELDCGFITLGVPVTYNPENYPAYCLTDTRLQRDIRSALRDHGVAVRTGEGFFFRPGLEAMHFAPMLDAMAEIGAQKINLVSLNDDWAHSLDLFAAMAEMAAERGMSSSVEFVAGQIVGNLEEAAKAVRHVGRADFKLVIDLLHFARSGGAVADLTSVDGSMIGYIQLCDCSSTTTDFLYEAMYERLCPGEGELHLAEILAALPRVPVGIEIPQRSLAEAGVGPKERLAPCVDAARVLLAEADALGA